MPLQHINDRVLKRMQRRVNRAATEELLGRLRHAIPDLALRTTFIVGFPGETDAEFEELIAFVQAPRFERVGVFPYSLRAGHAGGPARRPSAGRGQAGAAQPADGSSAGGRLRAGAGGRSAGSWTSSIDGPDPEVPNHVLARSHADAPDIDGLVRVKGKAAARGRPRACQGDGGGRLRPGRPRRRHGEVGAWPRPLTPPSRPPDLQPAEPADRQPLRAGDGAVRADRLRESIPGVWLWCLVVFAAAAVTDWLDGYFARKQGLTSTLGRNLDPLVDKVLMCGAFIFLLDVPGRRRSGCGRGW